MHGAIEKAWFPVNQGVFEIENLLKECKQNIQAKSFPSTSASFIEACRKVNLLKLEVILLNTTHGIENTGVAAENLFNFAILGISFRDIYREIATAFLPDYSINFEKIDEQFKATLFQIKQGLFSFHKKEKEGSTFSESTETVQTVESEKMHVFSDVSGQICNTHKYLRRSKKCVEVGAETIGLEFFFKAGLTLLFAVWSFELVATVNSKTQREIIRDFENLKTDFENVYRFLEKLPIINKNKLVVADKYLKKATTEIAAMLSSKKDDVCVYSKSVVFKDVFEKTASPATLSLS